jgi:hypothetical protein
MDRLNDERKRDDEKEVRATAIEVMTTRPDLSASPNAGRSTELAT